jgi:hypothetical protein
MIAIGEIRKPDGSIAGRIDPESEDLQKIVMGTAMAIERTKPTWLDLYRTIALNAVYLHNKGLLNDFNAFASLSGYGPEVKK